MPHILLGRRRGLRPSDSRDVFSRAAQHNARSPDPQARGLLSHGRRRGRHSVPYTGRGAAEAVQHNSQTLRTPFANARTVVSPFRRRRKHRSNAQEPWFATHRTTTLSMVRKVQRNSHPKPIWDNLSALMVLNVDSPDRHDRLKSLWSESGIRSITRVMSPALPWALPWAPALPRRAGHRELVRRWAHGHALW